MSLRYVMLEQDSFETFVNEVLVAPRWRPLASGQLISLTGPAGGLGVMLARLPAGFRGRLYLQQDLQHLLVIQGSLHSQGRLYEAGDAYVPAAQMDETHSQAGAIFLAVVVLAQGKKSPGEPGLD